MKKLAFITFLFVSYYSSATTRYWVGTTSNWNVAANWNTVSGGGGSTGIPATTDDIVFDGNGLHDCTINISITCKTFTVLAGYTKTITQSAGSTITINGAATWSGGIFTGGNSNISATTGTFTLSGTAFTNTSATLAISGNSTWSSGTFNGGSSTVTNTGTFGLSGATFTMTGGTLSITGNTTWSSGSFNGGSSTITNRGTFTLSGATFTSTSGTLSIGKDFSFTSGSFAHNNGTVSFDQSLSFTSIAVSNSTALTFNHVLAMPYYATTTFNNSPSINGNLTLNGAGAASQTITFSSSVTVNGNLSIITSSGGNQTISFPSATTTLTVNGSMSVTGAGTAIINTGKINANGNVTYSNTSTTAGGSGTLNISGSGTQTITGSGTFNQGNLPNVTINSTGTVNLASYITCTNGWTYNTGTINGGTSTVCFYNTGAAYTVAGTHTLNNVVFYGSYATFTINNDLTVTNLTFDSNTNGFTAAISSSITSTGNFTMQGSNYITSNTGTINVGGDITNTNTSTSSGGSATININGTSTQTLTAPTTLGQGSFPNISINKTGTLNLVNYVTCGGTSWTLTSGTINPGTSTVNFYNTTPGSTFTVSGTQTLNNVIFYGNYATPTHTVSNNLTTNNLTFDATNSCVVTISNSITANGTLTYSGSGNLRLNTGTINVKGDIIDNNTNTGNGGGTANFIINGTVDQTLTGTSAADQGALPPFKINKASGTLNLAGFITFYNGFTWTAGTVAPGTSTCVFYNAVGTSQAVSASAAGMSFNNVLFEQPDYLLTSLSTDISVLGTFTIAAASGVKTNGHNISIGGNFTSLNTTASSGSVAFNPGVGTVTFNGTGLQTITMNNPSSTTNLAYFYNLVINNTAVRSTNDDITLADILSVTNSITFTNGKMLTTSSKYLNLKTGATSNIGSATSYVNGPMNYIMAFNGSRTLNFPVGEGSKWRYVVLNLTHNGAASYTYTTQVIHTSAGSLGYTLPATIERVSGVRYTQIDRTLTASGATSNNNLSGNQQITMYYDTDDQVGDYTNLTIAKTTGSGSPWVDIGGVATGNTTGTITSTSSPTSFTGFSKFSVANKVTGTNSLPIKLVSFEAAVIGKKIQLTWQTATEINNDHFELMRSKNGIEWETLETIKAAGNSTVLRTYSAEDVSPLPGTSFYRLRQVDFDGQFQNYTISVESAKASIAIYPNPASSQVTIEGENLNFQDLKVVNLLGAEISSSLRLILSDKNKMIIDISSLPSQTYIFKIKNMASIIYKQEPVLNSQR